MNLPGLLRGVAQRVRHAPLAEHLDFVWDAIRVPYREALEATSARGVVVRVGGQPMRVHSAFAAVSWEGVEVASYGRFLRELEPGMAVVDVGGHIGTYSILASRAVGPTGRVLVFEPGETARLHLLQHLVWNACVHNTFVRETCLGERTGVASYYHVPQGASGQAGFVQVEGHAVQQVPVTTLDRELEHCGLVPALIKIDVEGGEWSVLRGAEATLARHRPRLLLSLHPEALRRQDVSEEHVLGWLRERGYDLDVFERDHETHVLGRCAR